MFFKKMFDESNLLVIKYNGCDVFSCLKFKKKGRYKITIRKVVSFSQYNQSIILHIGNLKGTVWVNGKTYVSCNEFSQVILTANELNSCETVLEIELIDGSFIICNGSDPIGTGKIWRSLTMGSALMINAINNGWYRINCNDFEADDDFDDLILEMKIERDSEVVNISNDCELRI